MLKFTLASRHKDEGTRERFFYEWSMIHVALMLTTKSTFNVFRRYVQHYGILGVSNDMLIHPFSDQDWESFADHWVENHEDVMNSVRNRDYVERMQPHSFGSHRFITGLSTFETVYEEPGFRSGGVKLIHFLKKKPELSQEEFNKRFREGHASVWTDLIRSKGLVRKYVQDTPVDLDPAIFKGTLFELGSIGLYAGMEEFWVESVDAVARLRRDPQICTAISGSERNFVEPEGSISMVVNERVVFDFVTPSERTPLPAVCNPDSLEAIIDRQGYKDFDKPGTGRR
jgi:hypothetical protein